MSGDFSVGRNLAVSRSGHPYAGLWIRFPSLVEVLMSTPVPEGFSHPPVRPHLSVEELLAAKHTQPIRSLDDLAADTFESDEELDEFLAFTYAERHRDVA